MPRGDRSRLVAGAILVVGAAVVAGLAWWALGSLSEEDEGPEATADAFAAAWSEGDGAALRALVVEPATVDGTDPVAIGTDLGATATAIELGLIDEDGDEGRARFTATLTLGDVGGVSWDGELPLVDVEDAGWRVEWSETAMHPLLPPGGSITRTTTWPARAAILGAGGRQLVGDVERVRIGIEPRRFDRAASIPILAQQLQLDPVAIEEALDQPWVQPDHFVQIAELTAEEFEDVRPVIFPILGVTFPRETGRGGLTRDFARHVVGRYGEVTAERLEELGPLYAVGDLVGLDGLEARYEEQLAGRPDILIQILDGAGGRVQELGSFPGVDPVPVRTTLDPDVQRAAELALANVPVPAALVAVDAATGEVRAAASRPLDEAFDRAIGGAYPPGSTFKVVTAYALLANGLQPGSPVECPAELDVDGRRFRNFEGGALGTVPFERAFADSCNTAMIGAAGALPETALADAASTFGFGVDYSLGPTTLGGSFPAPATEVERAASAIGQAQVTASPLHMATVAAAVLDGTWRSPMLLPDEAGERTTRPLDPTIRSQLAGLMRLVVTDGSGTAANVPGLDVIGKTGTAEFGSGDPLPTHAWFIGAWNGLGFAVVLEGGGVGGRDAAPIAAQFLSALPGG